MGPAGNRAGLCGRSFRGSSPLRSNNGRRRRVRRLTDRSRSLSLTDHLRCGRWRSSGRCCSRGSRRRSGRSWSLRPCCRRRGRRRRGSSNRRRSRRRRGLGWLNRQEILALVALHTESGLGHPRVVHSQGSAAVLARENHFGTSPETLTRKPPEVLRRRGIQCWFAPPKGHRLFYAPRQGRQVSTWDYEPAGLLRITRPSRASRPLDK